MSKTRSPEDMEAVFHGNDIAEAESRADRIGGVVIYSWPPATHPNPAWGYYSEPGDGGLLRNGEQVMYRARKR